ncbi:hypothetical protein ACJ2A9_00630 [Anaerobacillus sp. MEB173]|uniref:hypothetical protein n=1 Tax=Anaerobacillus sp. MEB173 TaxID=3383345 RepID=UPI003F91F5ED
MLITEVVAHKGTEEALKEKQFMVKEILESEELSHGLQNPDLIILYEKVEWRKIVFLKETNGIVENKVKTEEFVKIIKNEKNSSSSKCLKVYLLSEEQTLNSVIKEIQRNY